MDQEYDFLEADANQNGHKLDRTTIGDLKVGKAASNIYIYIYI